MKNAIFIIKGKLRKAILFSLQDKPKTGKRISKELERHLASVSRILLELEKRRFVKCINPDDDRYRYYKLTAKGKRTLRKISEIEK